MGIFFAFWRRLFGGYDAKFNLFDKRGIQMILCILVTFLWEFFVKSQTWWASLNPELTNNVYSDVSIPEDNKLRIGMKLLTEDGYDEIIKIDLLPQNELIKTYTYDVTNGIDTYITNGFISHNHY